MKFTGIPAIPLAGLNDLLCYVELILKNTFLRKKTTSKEISLSAFFERKPKPETRAAIIMHSIRFWEGNLGERFAFFF